MGQATSTAGRSNSAGRARTARRGTTRRRARSLGALAAARENARRSREVVSTELWESINVTFLEASRAERRADPHAFFTWVRERAAAFNGTADATLSRDEA